MLLVAMVVPVGMGAVVSDTAALAQAETAVAQGTEPAAPGRPQTARLAARGNGPTFEEILSNLSVEEARQRALETGRTLVLWFSDTHDARCRLHEALPWSDPAVLEWVGRAGLVVRVEAAEHLELLVAHGVYAVPALLRFNEQGHEIRRADFLHLSQIGLLNTLEYVAGERWTDERLLCMTEDAFIDESTRSYYQCSWTERLPSDQALDYVLSVWRGKPPSVISTMRTKLAEAMAALVKRSPEAAAPIEQLYADAKAAVETGAVDEALWFDWLALAEGLQREEQFHAVLRGRLAQGAASTLPASPRSLASRRCEQREDWAALGLLIQDGVARATYHFEPDLEELENGYVAAFGPGGHKRIGPPHEFMEKIRQSLDPDHARPEVLALYLPLVVAGRDADAEAVADVLLQHADDVESRVGLVETALRADAHWHEQVARGDALARLLAASPSPLERMRPQLRAWLEGARREPKTSAQFRRFEEVERALQ